MNLFGNELNKIDTYSLCYPPKHSSQNRITMLKHKDGKLAHLKSLEAFAVVMESIPLIKFRGMK